MHSCAGTHAVELPLLQHTPAAHGFDDDQGVDVGAAIPDADVAIPSRLSRACGG